MKLTEWYPASVKPVRKGVYMVMTPWCHANKFAYFDERGWRLCGDCQQNAEEEKDRTEDMDMSSMNMPYSKWRGLAQNPSKGKK